MDGPSNFNNSSCRLNQKRLRNLHNQRSLLDYLAMTSDLIISDFEYFRLKVDIAYNPVLVLGIFLNKLTVTESALYIPAILANPCIHLSKSWH